MATDFAKAPIEDVPSPPRSATAAIRRLAILLARQAAREVSGSDAAPSLNVYTNDGVRKASRTTIGRADR